MIKQIIKSLSEVIGVDVPLKKTVWESNSEGFGSNEMLLFIKPEIVSLYQKDTFESIMSMVMEKLSSFDVKVHQVDVLNGSYLKEHNIIAQHYGVINKLAKSPKTTVSQSGKEKFVEKFGKDFDTSNVVGGIEFLEKFPFFTPTSLDILWQNSENIKLAGGTYVENLKVDGEELFLIDGFHPRQLEHFTTSDKGIITFHVSTNTSWEEARQNLIGATNPLKAEKGSIRGTLLAKKDEYGLSEVSQGMNGIHLSAGPVEGLVELVRYIVDSSPSALYNNLERFSFGSMLLEKFEPKQVKMIIENENVKLENGTEESTFDLTEEMNAIDSIDALSVNL